jgi:N-methylhydantoinase B
MTTQRDTDEGAVVSRISADAEGRVEGESGWGDFDPILAAVLVKRFEAITKKMTNTLLRSGRSGVLNMARDFSCAIVGADDRLIVSAEGLPVHVIGIERLSRAMHELQPELKSGDAFLHNSPYHGNTHPADYSILVPVFWEEEHVFTAITRAHQADCGNALPSTYMPLAEDVYAEGALIFPCVQVQRHGQDIADVIRMCRARIRVPDQWYGDYLAQIGAARVAERALLDLLVKYGRSQIRAFVEQWFAYGDRRMAKIIGTLPGGTWSGTSYHDSIPGIDGMPDAGIPVHVEISIDPDRSRITVDLSDNIDVLPCGLNLSEATATSAAVSGILNSLHEAVPHNDGAFSRVSVRLREGSLIGGGKHPTSMSMATTNVSDRLVGLVQSTMAMVGPGTGVAEGGVPMPPAWAVISGRDGRRGYAPFVNEIFLAVTGGPASAGCDGWLGYGNAGTAGLLHRDSVEVLEQRYPIRVISEEIIADSGGAGKWIGAPGSKAVFAATNDPVLVSFACDGHDHPPRGVRGGANGAPSDAMKYNRREWQRIPLFGNELLGPDEQMMSISPGGGGYGDPVERDPELVRESLLAGWITKEAAYHTYAVVLNGGWPPTVDLRATRHLREHKQRDQGSSAPRPRA